MQGGAMFNAWNFSLFVVAALVLLRHQVPAFSTWRRGRCRAVATKALLQASVLEHEEVDHLNIFSTAIGWFKNEQH
jgi:hypothetical protein